MGNKNIDDEIFELRQKFLEIFILNNGSDSEVKRYIELEEEREKREKKTPCDNCGKMILPYSDLCDDCYKKSEYAICKYCDYAICKYCDSTDIKRLDDNWICLICGTYQREYDE